jgi:hypothetical protein
MEKDGSQRVRVQGLIKGQRIDPERGKVLGEIVHVSSENGANGPAANSFILIETSKDGERKARYLSWINYYDIDYLSIQEFGLWRVIEPADHYNGEVEWHPYGWKGALPARTIASFLVEALSPRTDVSDHGPIEP